MTYSLGISLAKSAFSSPAPSPSLAVLASLISLDLSLVSHLRKAQAASTVQMPMIGVSSEHRVTAPRMRSRIAFSFAGPSKVPLVITSIAPCSFMKYSFFFGSFPVLSGWYLMDSCRNLFRICVSDAVCGTPRTR